MPLNHPTLQQQTDNSTLILFPPFSLNFDFCLSQTFKLESISSLTGKLHLDTPLVTLLELYLNQYEYN